MKRLLLPLAVMLAPSAAAAMDKPELARALFKLRIEQEGYGCASVQNVDHGTDRYGRKTVTVTCSITDHSPVRYRITTSPSGDRSKLEPLD